jgi:hypothetical protein
VGGFLSTNNPYAFDGYIWPVPDTFGFTPGSDGQVLTIADKTTGTLAWTNTGTLTTVAAGSGVNVTSTATTATVSLATVPSITPGNFGGTALIPTLSVNSYGQLVSVGQANPFSEFQTATVSAPPDLVLNFEFNNLTWEWVLQGNITIQNPLNASSGQTGYLLVSQNPLSPYTMTWGAAWKFPNSLPYSGNSTLAAVDLIEFVVVSPNYIVVKNIVTDIG